MLFIYVASSFSFGGFSRENESDDVFNENKEKVDGEIFNSFSFNFEDEKTYTKWNFGATCMLLKQWRTNDVNKAKINFVRKFLLLAVIFHAIRKPGVTKGTLITSGKGNKLQFLMEFGGIAHQWCWRAFGDFFHDYYYIYRCLEKISL